MTKRLQESGGVPGSLGDHLVGLGLQERLGQEPDAQLARVGADLLGVRARGRRGNVGIARRRTVHSLEDRRRVPDRLRDDEFDREAGHVVADQGPFRPYHEQIM